MKTMTCIGTAATLGFIAASAAAAPSSRFEVSGATITQIADLGGAQSMALDINDDGYIAGWSEVPTGERHALYNIAGVLAFDLSKMYNLGRSEARGINNSKHVVGSMIDASGRGRAFRWLGGWVDILDDDNPSAIDHPISSDAVAIADNEYVVGHRNFMYFPYGQPPVGGYVRDAVDELMDLPGAASPFAQPGQQLRARRQQRRANCRPRRIPAAAACAPLGLDVGGRHERRHPGRREWHLARRRARHQRCGRGRRLGHRLLWPDVSGHEARHLLERLEPDVHRSRRAADRHDERGRRRRRPQFRRGVRRSHGTERETPDPGDLRIGIHLSPEFRPVRTAEAPGRAVGQLPGACVE